MKTPLVLSNGMRVHLLPYSGTQAVTVLVLVKVGSRYEYPAINGASHFIEHLMFKGTKRRPTTLNISRDLDAVGAEYNAFTGKEYTGYYVTIESSQVPLAVDLLHDMIFHSTYDPKEMNRERRVIIEEIKMYNENPVMHVEELLEATMFDGSPLGWDIAGDAKRMLSMTRKNVITYRDQHYVPSRMVVGLAGCVDKKALALVKKTFESVKGRHSPVAFEGFHTEGDKGGQKAQTAQRLRCRIQNKKLEQIQLALGFPSYGASDKRNSAVSLLATILGGTMSSRLFISVRERKGLCYHVRAENGTYDDVGAFMIRSGLDQARLKDAVKTILSEVEKIKKTGVTACELREAKENYRGRILLKLEESSARADWYVRQELLLDRALTPEERMKEIDAVTVSEVQQVAQDILNIKKMSIAAIGPFKDEKAFLKAAGLSG
ncbi:insulinase family protein [Candidatus Uhrbacteria bacterium]|nr:insulinase family protein [Candidatus Uhrbacteria bacterium]